MKKIFLSTLMICILLLAYTKNVFSQNCCNANFTANGVKHLTWKFFPADSTDKSSYNWKWEFGDGSVSQQVSPNHTYSIKGSYVVKLTKTRKITINGEEVIASCAISKPVIIQPIKVEPICLVKFTAQQTGNVVSITNESLVQPGQPIYKWNFGDGNTGSAKNPVHAYLKPGTYTIRLKIFTAIDGKLVEGCSDTIKITIAGKSECNAEFTYQKINNTVYFNSNPLKAGEYTYWEFGDGSFSDLSNPSHEYANPGQYNVIHHKGYLTNSDSCASAQLIYIPIDSNNVPIDSSNVCFANFYYELKDDSVIFQASGTSGFHYWTTGDGVTLSGIRASYIYPAGSTSYTVCHSRITATGDSCYECKVIDISRPSVSPNPADGFININSTNETLSLCMLYDFNGNVVASKDYIQSLQTTLSIQNIPTGYYTLWVYYGNNRTASYNILVQH
jgi:PKD repeat protein